jgi:hypothetical protein
MANSIRMTADSAGDRGVNVREGGGDYAGGEGRGIQFMVCVEDESQVKGFCRRY